MKKFILKVLFAFFLFCLIFFLSKKKVRGDYASDYQAYVNETGIYQTMHNNYLTARSNYIASGSLDAKDKAQFATLQFLQTRNTLLITYLTAIRSKIQSSAGISDVDKASLISSLNGEMIWYANQNITLTSAGSLDDLVSDSNSASDQYKNLTLIKIYTSIINLGVGMNSYIRNELTNEISTLNVKIAEIKANQDKDTSLIERSIIDVQNKISRSIDKENQAKDEVNSIKPSNITSINSFQDAQNILSDGQSYLKEANQELLQIITQIKTAN